MEAEIALCTTRELCSKLTDGVAAHPTSLGCDSMAGFERVLQLQTMWGRRVRGQRGQPGTPFERKLRSPGLQVPEGCVVAYPGVGRLWHGHKWVVVQELLCETHQTGATARDRAPVTKTSATSPVVALYTIVQLH